MLSLRNGDFTSWTSWVFQLGSETHRKLKEGCTSGRYKTSCGKMGVRWKIPSSLYLEARVCVLPQQLWEITLYGKKPGLMHSSPPLVAPRFWTAMVWITAAPKFHSHPRDHLEISRMYWNYTATRYQTLVTEEWLWGGGVKELKSPCEQITNGKKEPNFITLCKWESFIAW